MCKSPRGEEADKTWTKDEPTSGYGQGESGVQDEAGQVCWMRLNRKKGNKSFPWKW